MGRFFHYLIFCILTGFATLAFATQGIEEGAESGFEWNLQANAVTFLGKNSYFGESKEIFGANTDDWTEAAVELGFLGFMPLGKGTFFGALSGLHTKTWGNDASGLTFGLDGTGSFDIEQAHIGWRSGSTFPSLDKDALTLKAGNFDYLVGTGLLVADATADGGRRGGWYLSWRSAFRESFLARLESGAWKIDGFYLQGEGRHSDERVYGYGGDFEYEYTGAGLAAGLLYVKVPDQQISENTFQQKYDSLSLRANWSATDRLTFAGEYAYQSRLGAHPRGWFLKGGYQWTKTRWSPEISYRYAHFDGDDLLTPADEGFETAAYGFTDYGYWVQGEISGGYPLENSNLKSHMLRLQLWPTNRLKVNAIYYDLTLDQPNIFGEPVGSTDWGDEVNLVADYSINANWFLSGVFGWLVPGEAASNWTGGDKTWVYGMIYVSFSL